jgi:hypothetical protein
MDEPYEVIGGKKVFKDVVEFQGRQAEHIADAKVNYTTGNLDAESEVIAAFNATNATINSILAVLETLGFLKSA